MANLRVKINEFMVNVEVRDAAMKVLVFDLVGSGKRWQPSYLQGSSHIQEAVTRLCQYGAPVGKGFMIQQWVDYKFLKVYHIIQ